MGLPYRGDAASWQRPLVELGFDSLKAADALQALNAQFGIELGFETTGLAEGVATPESLVESVMVALGAAAEPQSRAAPAVTANPLFQNPPAAAVRGDRASAPHSAIVRKEKGALSAGLPSPEFRRGQLEWIRMLPTVEARLAAARVRVARGHKGVLQRGGRRPVKGRWRRFSWRASARQERGRPRPAAIRRYARQSSFLPGFLAMFFIGKHEGLTGNLW